jgi:hypothetical protein
MLLLHKTRNAERGEKTLLLPEPLDGVFLQELAQQPTDESIQNMNHIIRKTENFPTSFSILD